MDLGATEVHYGYIADISLQRCARCAEEQYPDSDSPLCTPTPNAESGVQTPVSTGVFFYQPGYLDPATRPTSKAAVHSRRIASLFVQPVNILIFTW